MTADEPKSVWFYANDPLGQDIFKTFFLAEHRLCCGLACKEQKLTDCEGAINQICYAVSKAQGSDEHTEGAISA